MNAERESCGLSTRPRALLSLSALQSLSSYIICLRLFFLLISFGVSFCNLSVQQQRTGGMLFPCEILSRRCTLSTMRQGNDEHQFPWQNGSLDYKLLFNPFCVKGYNNPCKMCSKSCAWLCEVMGQKSK